MIRNKAKKKKKSESYWKDKGTTLTFWYLCRLSPIGKNVFPLLRLDAQVQPGL